MEVFGNVSVRENFFLLPLFIKNSNNGALCLQLIFLFMFAMTCQVSFCCCSSRELFITEDSLTIFFSIQIIYGIPAIICLLATF